MNPTFKIYDLDRHRESPIDLETLTRCFARMYEKYGNTILLTLKTTIEPYSCPRCSKKLLQSLTAKDMDVFQQFHNKGIEEIQNIFIEEHGVREGIIYASSFISHIHALSSYKPLNEAEIAPLLEDLSYLQDLCLVVFTYCPTTPEEDMTRIDVSYLTSEIVLEDINFGTFTISIDLVPRFNTDSGRQVMCVPTNYNRCYTKTGKQDGRWFHPHVNFSSKVLCLGNALVPVLKAYHSLNLSSYFDIVQSTLNTYNPDSPYSILDTWRGVRCQSCDTVYTAKDFTGKIKSFIACSCGIYYCPDCIVECSECAKNKYKTNNKLCGRCSHLCPICNKRYCNSHIKQWNKNLYGDQTTPRCCTACYAAQEEEKQKIAAEKARIAAVETRAAVAEVKTAATKVKTLKDVMDADSQRKAEIAAADAAQLQTLKQVNAQIFGSWDPISEGDL